MSVDLRLPENRIIGFLNYYEGMVKLRDIDPGYPALTYLFDRFELNIEQKFWLCWLYGVCYCPPTIFWVYNEFPDFDRVSVPRMENWHKDNWKKMMYQRDRIYVKGKLVEMFKSYRELIGDKTQEEFFQGLCDSSDPVKNFHTVWDKLESLHLFGRFSLYIYTEALRRCAKLPIMADTYFMAEAESSRNGLCYALSQDQFVKDKNISKENMQALGIGSDKLFEYTHQYLTPRFSNIASLAEETLVDIWHYETVLCAYKGLFKGNRYLGYYVDRNQEEIRGMQKVVTEGVCWDVMWDFRSEYFNPKLLGEKNGWEGRRKDLKEVFKNQGSLVNFDLCAG